jgi:hypothetical protein
MDFVKSIYSLVARRAARRVVVGRLRQRGAPTKGRFTREDVDRILDSAWDRYDERVGKVAPQPTVGSRMNVRLACFTLAFLDELVSAGVERSYGIEIVADAAWSIYSGWAALANLVGRIPGRKRPTLAWVKAGAGSAPPSLSFPFNAPGYVIEPVRSKRGTAFDVVRCPVAEYFRQQGATDLCVAAWCNLDFALGEVTHNTLTRTKTLVEGADRCDFRVLPHDGALPL